MCVVMFSFVLYGKYVNVFFCIYVRTLYCVCGLYSILYVCMCVALYVFVCDVLCKCVVMYMCCVDFCNCIVYTCVVYCICVVLYCVRVLYYICVSYTTIEPYGML